MNLGGSKSLSPEWILSGGKKGSRPAACCVGGRWEERMDDVCVREGER